MLLSSSFYWSQLKSIFAGARSSKVLHSRPHFCHWTSQAHVNQTRNTMNIYTYPRFKHGRSFSSMNTKGVEPNTAESTPFVLFGNQSPPQKKNTWPIITTKRSSYDVLICFVEPGSEHLVAIELPASQRFKAPLLSILGRPWLVT